MNSSTSNFEALPQASKKTWIWLLFWGLVLAVPPLLLSAIVDPFNSIAINYRIDIDRKKEFRGNNVAQWAAFEISRDLKTPREDIDVILLGDSRTRQLTGGLSESRFIEVDGKGVYNLSFGGASIYEQISFLEKWSSQLPNAKTLFWQIDYYKLRKPTLSENRSEVSFRHSDNSFVYLSDPGTLKKSFLWLKENGIEKFGYNKKTELNPERLVLGHKCIKQMQRPTEDQINTYLKGTRFTDPTIAINALENTIYPFVELLESHDWQVYYFMPPIPKEASAGRSDVFKKTIKTVNKNFQSTYPMLKMNKAFVKSTSWLDALHICPDDASAMLNHFIGTLPE